MKPESQRIAIAEACGWKEVPQPKSPYGEFVSRVWQFGGVGGRLCGFGSLPDYLNDLNAMHEVESKLRENQFHYFQYTRELWSVLFPHVEYSGNLGYLGFNYVNATASQRAEAFLKTLNLWDDSK